MKLDIERRDSVSICRISGELDAGNSRELLDAFDREFSNGATKAIFSLSGLDYVDSSGLGALVKALKSARAKGGDVKLAGLKPEVRKVLELTRLDRIFDIFPSETHAIESLLAAKR
jgi:anti-sigma B factor antagonist